MRDSSHRAFDQTLLTMLRLFFAFSVAASLLAAGLYVAAALTGYSEDGVSASEWVTAIGSGLVVFLGLVAFNFYATHVVPRLERGTRTGPVIGLAAGVALMVSFSVPANLQTTAKPIAEAAERELERQYYQTRFSVAEKAARDVDAAIPIVKSASDNAERLTAMEKLGKVCGHGAGDGPCVAVLSTLSSSASNTLSALHDSRAETSPLIRKGREILADIQRIAAASDLSDSEKTKRLRAEFKQLAGTTDAIVGALPISGVQNLTDTLDSELNLTGIPAEARAIIKSTFSPISGRLREKMGDFESLRWREATAFVAADGWALYAKHFDKIIVPFVMSFVIDLLGLLASLVLSTVNWARMDREAQTYRSTPYTTKRPGRPPLKNGYRAPVDLDDWN